MLHFTLPFWSMWSMRPSTAFLLAGSLLGLAAAPAPVDPVPVLRGQVVCSECWFEAERPKVPYGGEADVACAQRCAARGVPQAIAVREEGGYRLYRLERGAFDPGEDGWLPLVTRQVEVRGPVRTEGKDAVVRVDGLSPLDPLPRDTPAPDAAPALELQDLDGVPQSLASLRGRVVVVNFWATWCLPCREEMPALGRVQARFAARGVQFVGAAADEPSARSGVMKFLETTPVPFPVWLGATTDAMSPFGLPPMLPGTVVLDREGRVRARFPGVVTEAALTTALEGVLAPPLAAARADAPRGRSKGSLVPS
jgi:thiol-disulfide isomerase/thioredoxin